MRLVVVALLHLGAAWHAPPALASTCQASSDISFVCGLKQPEDLAVIPDSAWMIASSYPAMPQGTDLYLINMSTRSSAPLGAVPRVGRAGRVSWRKSPCTTPPDPARFVAHGLHLRSGKAGLHTLFVVNHGDREAIERFSVDARGDKPVVEWTGCIRMPKGSEANSLASLPDGDLLITTMYDPGDMAWQSRMAKLRSGDKSGLIYRWNRRNGFQILAAPPIAGPNGIEATSDGKYAFVTGWSERAVYRLDLGNASLWKRMSVDFIPDNIHWGTDNILTVAGKRSTVADLLDCYERSPRPIYCASQWGVAAIYPLSFSIKWERSGDGSGAFGDVTTAILVGENIWLGSIHGDRVGIVPRQPND